MGRGGGRRRRCDYVDLPHHPHLLLLNGRLRLSGWLAGCDMYLDNISSIYQHQHQSLCIRHPLFTMRRRGGAIPYLFRPPAAVAAGRRRCSVVRR